MRPSCTVCAALLLSACISAAPPPDWQANAFAALNNYTTAYLEGNTRLADAEFARAKVEIARTARLDLMARLELVRCAVQTASLVRLPCAGYEALAAQVGAPEHAYADFIRGRWVGLNAALLPDQYQGLVRQFQREVATPGSVRPESRLHQFSDPLARLIAAGSLLQIEQLTPSDAALASDAASSQGWRRPLLSWLGVQLNQAQSSLDTAGAQRIKQRMDMVLGSATP